MRAFHLVASSIWFRLLAGVLGQESGCDDNILGPIRVPFTNVTLSNGKTWRGAYLSIGSGPQQLAFSIGDKRNNTYVFDGTAYCEDADESLCETVHGGYYHHSDSYTWSSQNTASLIPNADQGYDNSQAIIATETLHVNSTLDLPIFPIVVPQQNNMGMNSIGMGPSSYLLTRLKDEGKISSLSWSFYAGETGSTADHQMDGGLVLGGIDTAKTSGQNYTKPLTKHPSCLSGLLVSVSNIEAMIPGRGNVSLVPQGALQMCVQTDFNLITLPEPVFNTFMNVWNRPYVGRAPSGPDSWGVLYEPIDRFPGDLKFTIDNEIDIIVPNHQLMSEYVQNESDGTLTVNGTYQELRINPLVEINRNDLPLLGLTFLQAAYLHVNWDKSNFALWQANPTTEETLVGVGNGTSIGCPTEVPAETPSDGAQPNRSNNNSLSTGAIAGIAVGAAAAFLLGAGLLGWCIRRGRAGKAEAMNDKPPRYSGAQLVSPLYGTNGQQYGKAELQADSTGVISPHDGWRPPLPAKGAEHQVWLPPQEMSAECPTPR